MANTSAKKQAVANAHALKIMHFVSLAVNLLFLLSHFLLHRPASLKPYLVCSLPAFLLQFQLERMGRPKYDSKDVLVSAGDDLAQEGLTEWFFDVLYVTWGCAVLAAVTGTNKVWYLYLAIPSYASYKVYTMFFAGKGGLLSTMKQQPEGAQGAPTQSKRQEKMEKKRVKYMR